MQHLRSKVGPVNVQSLSRHTRGGGGVANYQQLRSNNQSQVAATLDCPQLNVSRHNGHAHGALRHAIIRLIASFSFLSLAARRLLTAFIVIRRRRSGAVCDTLITYITDQRFETEHRLIRYWFNKPSSSSSSI